MSSLADILEQAELRGVILKGLQPLKPDDRSRLDKKFRLEFNYNSNHIEGNTLTYGETELLLIFDQTKGDHELREYEEMKAHDVALKIIHEEVTDAERPLTEQFIRQLNQLLLVRPYWKDAKTPDGKASRKEIIPGQYKTSPNSVRLQNGERFYYASPEDTPIKMSELVAWFNQHSAKEHPVLLAALLHYQFVRIHPFDDGNGRVARLLMNYVLLKNNLPMVIIKSADKKQYLAALNRADAGDEEAFAAYVGEQLLWSLDLSIKAAKGQNIDEPDDLDKRIAVLAKGITNEKTGVKKNAEILEHLLKNSIFPLLNGFQEISLNRFSPFYESISFDYGINYTFQYSNKTYQDVAMVLVDHDERNPLYSIQVNFAMNGFKPDITSDFRSTGSLEINFEDYKYRIKSLKFEKYWPYTHQLSPDEQKQVINHIGTLVYDDIESKINHSNQNN